MGSEDGTVAPLTADTFIPNAMNNAPHTEMDNDDVLKWHRCDNVPGQRTLKPPASWISPFLQSLLDAVEDESQRRLTTTRKRRKSTEDRPEDVFLLDLKERLEFVLFLINSFASSKDWRRAVFLVEQTVTGKTTISSRAKEMLESLYDTPKNSLEISLSLDTLDFPNDSLDQTLAMVQDDAALIPPPTCSTPLVDAASLDNSLAQETDADVVMNQDTQDISTKNIHSRESSSSTPSASSLDDPKGGQQPRMSNKSKWTSKKASKATRRRRSLILPKRLKPINAVSATSKSRDRTGASSQDDRYHIVNQIVKQYLCQRCNQVFSRSDSYRRHIRSAHLRSDKKYVCVVCGLSSPRVDNVKKHLKRIHNLDGGVSVKDFIIETPAEGDPAVEPPGDDDKGK